MAARAAPFRKASCPRAGGYSLWAPSFRWGDEFGTIHAVIASRAKQSSQASASRSALDCRVALAMTKKSKVQPHRHAGLAGFDGVDVEVVDALRRFAGEAG